MEFLLVPAAALVLASLLAAQFLAHGASYGPRSRRVLALLVAPAAAVGSACAWALPSSSAWARAGIGLVAAAYAYLAVATTVVYGWRNRKVAALIGDIGAVRRRVADRQREVERLLWSDPGVDRAPLPVDRPHPDAGGQDWAAVLQEWLGAEPEQAQHRRNQVVHWEVEFRRAGRVALAARSRVLEAGWRDAPDGPERQALGARLAALWLVLQSLGSEEAGASAGSAPAGRLAAARQELARLQEELDHLLEQRVALLRRRLPLE